MGAGPGEIGGMSELERGGERGGEAGFVLETARLGLRPHEPSDRAFMQALNADPEVVRHTGEPTELSEGEATAIIEALRQQFAGTRTGRFLVIERASGERIGWCGLKRRPDGTVDLGYRFLRNRWGQGIATEAARACVEYGFGPLALDRIVATAAIENLASIAVLRRLGFRAAGERVEHGMAVRDFAIRRPGG